MLEWGWIISLGLAGISAVVEVVRLEGRLNSHDTLFVEREKLIIAHHDELKDRLERIERKLDEMCKLNGSATH